jgi:hypothetical protein
VAVIVWTVCACPVEGVPLKTQAVGLSESPAGSGGEAEQAVTAPPLPPVSAGVCDDIKLPWVKLKMVFG